MKPEVIICSKVERKSINSIGDFEVFNTDSATLVQELGESRAGKNANQHLDIITDIDVELASELQTIPQLFRLTNSEGVTFEWGDTFNYVECSTCIRAGNATRISFKLLTRNIDL
ncbi:MAG: hypothetical protein JZU49_00175 [Sulfuricurvum sp.]|nr:hypothetical protein [Sulfuricurvum sp.]